MLPREILLHLDASEAAATRLRLAMSLAASHGSRLSALFVDEWNLQQRETRATAEMGLVAARDLDRLDRSIVAEIERSATRLRTLLTSYHREHGLEFEWLRSEAGSDTALVPLLPYFDLCILGRDSLNSAAHGDRASCERLVMLSAAPIIFVPTDAKPSSLGKRILVAWDASRPAARAFNDAMPLLERADRITIVTVQDGLDREPPPDLQPLQQRLRRRCAQIEALTIRAPAQTPVASALQAKARELDCDLMVAGAFGHSRLKECLFGGVSRSLLQNMTLPVLMSH